MRINGGYQESWINHFLFPDGYSPDKPAPSDYVKSGAGNDHTEGIEAPPYIREYAKNAADRIKSGDVSKDSVDNWIDWEGKRPDILQVHSSNLSSRYMREFIDDYLNANITEDEFFSHLEELTLMNLHAEFTPEEHALAVKTVWKWASTFGLSSATRQMHDNGDRVSYGSCYFDTKYENAIQAKLNEWAENQCEMHGLDSSFIVDKPIMRLQYSSNDVTIRSEQEPPTDTAFWINPRDENAGILIDGKWLTTKNTFTPEFYTQNLNDIFKDYEELIKSSRPDIWRYLCDTTATIERLAWLNPSWVQRYAASNLAANQYDKSSTPNEFDSTISRKA